MGARVPRGTGRLQRLPLRVIRRRLSHPRDSTDAQPRHTL